MNLASDPAAGSRPEPPKAKLPEVWLRGPVAGIASALQPAAHALLQTKEEIETIVAGFPDELLWAKPSGVAAAGFHLQHIAGVIDRLFAYARGEALDEAQLRALRAEGQPPDGGTTTEELLESVRGRIDWAIGEMRNLPAETLTEARYVGKARLPSTVLGLLTHAAEHSQRHLGQLLVTVRVLRTAESENQLQ